MYTTTINQNGMILLNRDARQALGLKPGDKVMINFGHNSAKIERAMTDAEFFAKLDAMKSDRTKQNTMAHAGKSADELFSMALEKQLRAEGGADD